MNLYQRIQENSSLIKEGESTVLTKELLCFRIRKDKIIPILINPDSKINIEIAEELLEVFSQSNGDLRKKLEENLSHIFERFSGNIKFAKGLEKILYDRTEFDIEPKEELIKLRKNVFNCSSKFFCEKMDKHNQDFEFESNQNISFYRNRVAKNLQISLDDLMRKLYGDLPSYQKVLSFRKISAINLLHRYNCALVQGLLMRSEKIKVFLSNSDSSKLRQVLKYLRFNKLLARVSHFQSNENEIVLDVDGPLSMFLNTQKYGFNLAKFFPAILLQPNWEVIADVRIKKNKKHTLKLNQDCGIISHYKQFFAYVPEEIKLLSQKITKKMPDWTLFPSSDYINLGTESICFPDYSLEHISGQKSYIELFHTWHFRPLFNRLEQLEKIKGVKLLIGVDRILLKDKELSEKINSSNHFSKFGFFFKEFPSVSKICCLLSICT